MIDDLYIKLPRILQNLALTIYGKKVYRQRFGKGGVPDAYLSLESSFESLSDKNDALQKERFGALMKHVAKSVPFYRKIFVSNRLSHEDVTVDNFQEIFPVIRKADIVNSPLDFVSEEEARKGIRLQTSGSTGTPMTIFSSISARRINYHFYNLVLNEYNLSYRCRSTTFAGRVLYRDIGKDAARYDRWNKTQYLSSHMLSSQSSELYMEALNRWRPEYIDSYPSVLSEFVDFSIAKRLTPNFTPGVIITSSETLQESQRLKIQDFFQCPLVDHYGCTEMALSAYSKGGKYYAHPLYSLIELIPLGGGRHTPITTGLINFTMPLIRYEIGDVVRSFEHGSQYEFSAIDGRADDVIITPEGRHIGRLGPFFKGVQGIRSVQIVQHKIDLIEVRIVPSEEEKNVSETVLLKNLKERTSPQMDVFFTYHQGLGRADNGKFRSVVNLIT